MSEFTLKVQAPELAAAIAQLAAAVSGASFTTPAQHLREPVNSTQTAVPMAPAQTATTASPTTPAANSAPPAPPVVPTAAAPNYNQDQIMTAGAALIDAGKINDLMGLLNAFGVQAVTHLKQDQLGAFATELRKLGAQI